MRVTIVPSDHTIIRDGVAASLTDWPFEDGHIHAIQFLDGKGELELYGPPFTNEPFEGIQVIQPYLDHLDAWLAQQTEGVQELSEDAPYTEAEGTAP